MIEDIALTHDEGKQRAPTRDAMAVPRNAAGASDRLLSRELHPVVYKVIMGLALWFALAVWGFFAPSGLPMWC